MFSKVFSRVSKYQQLTAIQACAFRASTVANVSKKPSIGDAVTILQSKVSGINQVVSNGDAPPRYFSKRLDRTWYIGFLPFSAGVSTRSNKFLPFSSCSERLERIRFSYFHR